MTPSDCVLILSENVHFPQRQVYAAADALAGVAGGNGGGGSFKGVTVIGAKFGLDSRKTGDAATYVAITLLNQSTLGVCLTMTISGLFPRSMPQRE